MKNTFLPLTLICIFLAACGVRGTPGQSVADFEKANPAYHYVPPSVTTGSTEVRNYRNYSWTSPWSYFKPWRSYNVVFESGHYVETVRR